MNLDKNGLPVQADGDDADQLNRVGILAMSDIAWSIKLMKLMPLPGIYVRAKGRPQNDVSGDQLVPVFADRMLHDRHQFDELVSELVLRVGFAQNTHDQDGPRKILPDFLLHRVLPFITRVYCWKSITQVADLVLFFNTLVTVIDLRLRNDPDHVDPFVNAVATLYACNVYQPTYLSKLSVRMLDRVHSHIKDVVILLDVNGIAQNFLIENVVDALAHYHRATSGGNPEIGEVQIDQWRETLRIARA